MKLLFFNPELNAQHKTCATLAERGHVVLFARTAEEAWKIIQFHGVSLDLAVIHREGWTAGASSEAGIKLIDQIKADPAQADLPVIMTSWRWNGKDFTQHQQGPTGVNAYLKWPTSPEELLRTIEQVMGSDVPTNVSNSIPSLGMPVSAEPPTSAVLTGPTSAVQLESAGHGEISLGAINLEAPQFEGALQSTNEATAVTSTEAPAGEPHERLTLDSPSEQPISATQILQQNAVSIEATEPSVESGLSLTPPIQLEGASFEEPQVEFNPSLESSDATTVNASSLEPAELSGLTEPKLVIEAADPSAPSALDISDTGAFGGETELHIPEASLEARTDGSGPYKDGPSDDSLAGEMPYLFKQRRSEASPALANPVLAFSEPVGDAVVPGGAANAPDTEVLKKYLLLREQDVAVLSNQLATAREQIAALDKSLREERGKSADLSHDLSERQRKLDTYEAEKRAEFAALQAELEELRFQHKTKADKVRVLEIQVKDATLEIEKVKERVRTDIRKIRVREKELENRLEIVKKDSEALLAARETKMTELKRKLDLLEFNMDLLQDQYSREKETSALLRERLSKAAQVVRVAGGLLGPQQNVDEVTQSLTAPQQSASGIVERGDTGASKKVS